MVALAFKACTSMRFCGSLLGVLWVWKTDVNTTRRVRYSAVLFHGVVVGFVRSPEKSFEGEAGNVNMEGVHMSPGIAGSDRDCFEAPCVTCNRDGLSSNIQK